MRLVELPYIMARCLILTVLIETTIAFILGYRKKDLINVILVNVITNPIVVMIPVYFNIKYGIMERHISLAILEVLTLFVEGFIYSRFLQKKKLNPYLLSLILNFASYIIGVIINYL